jgi:hypothetical protein
MRYVYFMRTADPRWVKIGVARDPEARRRELQGGNPFRIEVAALIEAEAPFEVENFLHRRFKHLRSQGEWFRMDADLRRLIRGCSRFRLSARVREHRSKITLSAMPRSRDDIEPVAYALAVAAAVLMPEEAA